MYQNEMKAAAKNLVGAKPGQKVVIESRSSVIFNAALLVYIMPLVFFIGGYALAYALGALEGVRIAVSFAFLAVSAVVLVITQRSKKREPINFNIIEICEDGQND